MFQFPAYAPYRYGVRPSTVRVPPFRHLRIASCLRIPGAFRSLPRLSSPPEAKASSVRSSNLSRSCEFFHSFCLFRNCSPTTRRKNSDYYRLTSIFSFLLNLLISLNIFKELLPLLSCGRCIKQKTSWKVQGKISSLSQVNVRAASSSSSKKEVFQPHLPVRLPCYDLAPITSFALGRSLRSRTSDTPGFHGLTSGVYKARERIHRAMADARLLANPTSWSRVADSNPN